jgi:predicted phage-related endonuclease
VTELAKAGELDRRTYIGGSAIASIIGLQPPKWRTAVQLWQRMTSDEAEPQEPPYALRRRFARGKIVEPLVAQLLSAMHNVEPESIKSVSNQRYVDPDVPHFAAEIDFELPFAAVSQLFDGRDGVPPLDEIDGNEPVNVEIKTVHPFAAGEWGDEGTDEVPIHYAAQVYWGLGVTRRRFALCAALFGADDLVLYPIVADVDTIAAMRVQAAEFWQRVVDRDPPEPRSIADTGRLWPKDDGTTIEASPGIVAAVTTYRAMTEKRDSYKDGAEGVSLLIREHMKTATLLLDEVGAELATLKARRTSSIDADKLKAEFPDAYAACKREGTTRVLVLKG